MYRGFFQPFLGRCFNFVNFSLFALAYSGLGQLFELNLFHLYLNHKPLRFQETFHRPPESRFRLCPLFLRNV